MKITDFADRGEQKDFCVLFDRHEIEYDVKVKAVAAAKIVYHDAANDLRNDIVEASTQKDMLDRNIKTAISNIKERIRFAVRPHSRMASNEILEGGIQYNIPLSFSNEWRSEPETLCDAMHEYIVKFIISKWADLIGQKNEVYKLEADEALNNVHDIACNYVCDFYSK
jgi:hypothetical protein